MYLNRIISLVCSQYPTKGEETFAPVALRKQPNTNGCKFYVVLIKCPLFDLELFDYEQQIKVGIRKYKHIFFKKKKASEERWGRGTAKMSMLLKWTAIKEQPKPQEEEINSAFSSS